VNVFTAPTLRSVATNGGGARKIRIAAIRVANLTIASSGER
jgi:hypothetical protein